MAQMTHANPAPIRNEFAFTSVLSQFAEMIIAASRLPMLPVADWTTRAAQAINAGTAGSAALVVLVDTVARRPAHAGASSTAVPPAASVLLLSHAEHVAGQESSAAQIDAQPIAWDLAAQHPFLDAGFACGEVIATRAPVNDRFSLAILVYRSQDRLGPSGCAMIDGVRNFLVDSLRSFIDVPHPIQWLSARESDVLDLIAVGHSVNEIAARMGRSPHTVHDHLKAIHRKTGASTRGQLIAAATGRRSASHARIDADTQPTIRLAFHSDSSADLQSRAGG